MHVSLDEVKKDVSNKYLGKEGIHGIGISRSNNAIRVYVDINNSIQQKKVLEDIEEEATPFKVLIIDDKISSIT